MNTWTVAVVGGLCLMLAMNAHAYIGPGAGLSAIGSFLALLAGFVLALVGFVWLPIKRRLRNRKARRQQVDAAPAKEEAAE